MSEYCSPSSVDAFEARATPHMHVVMSMDGRCRIDSRSASARAFVDFYPGVGCVARPGAAATLRWTSPVEATLSTLYLHISASTLAAVTNEFDARPPSEVIATVADPALRQMCLTLWKAARDERPELYAATAAQFIAMHLLSRDDAGLSDAMQMQRDAIGPYAHRARLTSVLEMMTCRFTEDLSIADLAREAALSPFYFTQVFRKIVGQTPHQYLLELRLANAARRLIDDDRQIGSVAIESGFATPAYFASAFKKRFGCAPSSFRARKRGRNRRH